MEFPLVFPVVRVSVAKNNLRRSSADIVRGAMPQTPHSETLRPAFIIDQNSPSPPPIPRRYGIKPRQK
jgi:hypothetical protein